MDNKTCTPKPSHGEPELRGASILADMQEDLAWRNAGSHYYSDVLPQYSSTPTTWCGGASADHVLHAKPWVSISLKINKLHDM